LKDIIFCQAEKKNVNIEYFRCRSHFHCEDCERLKSAPKSEVSPGLSIDSEYLRKRYENGIQKEVSTTSDPAIIRSRYHFFNKLHYSFWENPQFVRWQLTRINKNYWNDVDATAEVYRDYRDYLNDNGKYGELERVLNMLSTDYPPEPKDNFEEWEQRSQWADFDFQGELPVLRKYGLDQLVIDNPPLQLNGVLDNITGEHEMLSPLSRWAATFMPIDYRVRFPVPLLLRKLPEWHKQIKKRPPDMSGNLVIYELSQNGWNDHDIGSLLFPDSYSDPLPRIKDARMELEEIVRQAYPPKSNDV
jgi:hypothetical protein